MDKHLLNKNGFSLLEILIAISLLTMVWISAVSVIIISKASGSLSKHKAQAIYVMQQAIEDLRKKPFPHSSSSSAVSLDTRGTIPSTSDDLIGTQSITITPIPNAYYEKVIVSVTWNESLYGKSKQMNEYSGTYIANDPQAN